MNTPVAVAELHNLWNAVMRGEIAVREALKHATRADVVASLNDDRCLAQRS